MSRYLGTATLKASLNNLDLDSNNLLISQKVGISEMFTNLPKTLIYSPALIRGLLGRLYLLSVDNTKAFLATVE